LKSKDRRRFKEPDGGIEPLAVETLQDGIGREVLLEAADMFLAETETRLLRMRKLADVGSPATLAFEAHALHGAAATFGLSRLSRLARDAQVAAMEPSERLVDVVDGLLAEFRAVRGELVRRLQDTGGDRRRSVAQ
jgi:HPt (histidine-containing phosphotransfer) domain-containing protein